MAGDPEQQAGQSLKFTITHYRQPHRTHEAFIKWITDEHLPIALPIFKKHGVLGYSLFVTPNPLNDALQQSLQETRPTWDVADFDCVIEYIIPEAQVVQNVMSDPEWLEICKDQSDWVDVPRALVCLGYHTPYLQDGNIVNMSK